MVGQAAVTLSLGNLAHPYDGTAKSVSVTTAPDDLADVTITYSQNGQTVAEPINVGRYAVVATLDNVNYTGTATGELVITKATPTVTWTTPAAITYGTVLSGTQLNATASVGGTFTYTPAEGTKPAVGTLTLEVVFYPTDTTNYTIATKQVSLTINKANQTISFPEIGAKTFGDAPFTVSAIGGASGEPVTFAVKPSSVCTVDGNTVSITGAGSCTVSASQAGDSTYNAAADVAQSFTIARADDSINISNLPTSLAIDTSFTPSYVVLGDGTTSVSAQTPTICTVSPDGVVTFLEEGTCTLRASITEGTNHLAAVGPDQRVTVVKQGTKTTLASSANPANGGEAITFTATVSPGNATGMVTFTDGSTVLGTTTLVNGKATFTTSSLSIGDHQIVAEYAGSATNPGSTSTALIQMVTAPKMSTSITLASSINPVKVGQQVTFTATLAPSTATGTVTFRDGTKVLRTVTISNGQATLTTKFGAPGNRVITAVYTGDATHATSTSASLTQVVKTK